MHETNFIYRPPRPGAVTKGLGIVACVTTISLIAWTFEQRRKRELARALASMPGAANILPALGVHSEMVLKQLGVGVRAKSERRQS
ncbi:hypothetical protein [Paraburkholderia sp. BCC1885]|uniref:hypothetical protein n=1 Tax=Paraburkholderia sp. BCC1885 TaxID=2562669 RepID=UPI0011844175|nr:hypothetical protein [Paraburkholderia sp. BCC1885]